MGRAETLLNAMSDLMKNSYPEDILNTKVFCDGTEKDGLDIMQDIEAELEGRKPKGE